MALAAALAVNHHLLCFSNPRTVTWVPTKLKPQKRAYLSFTSCTSSSSSSSSTSPEADLQTAESRVNLGLSLFSKGRVFQLLFFLLFLFFFFFFFFAFLLCSCAFRIWVCWILVYFGLSMTELMFSTMPCWDFLYFLMAFPACSCCDFDMVCKCSFNL